jgi:hypothetical protein
MAACREQTVEIALWPKGAFQTATQEFRTDEKAAGTNPPAAVLTPTFVPGGRGLLLAQGQER